MPQPQPWSQSLDDVLAEDKPSRDRIAVVDSAPPDKGSPQPWSQSLGDVLAEHEDKPERQSSSRKMSRLEAGMNSVSDMVTMGFDDEASGALGWLWNLGKAGSYERTRDQVRAQKKKAFADHPASSIAGATIGGLTPFGLAKSGLTIAAKAAGPGTRGLIQAVGSNPLARNVVAGSGQGALYGAGSGESLGDRALGAGRDAVLGGLAGGATHVAGGALRGIRQGGRRVVAGLMDRVKPTPPPPMDGAPRAKSSSAFSKVQTARGEPASVVRGLTPAPQQLPPPLQQPRGEPASVVPGLTQPSVAAPRPASAFAPARDVPGAGEPSSAFAEPATRVGKLDRQIALEKIKRLQAQGNLTDEQLAARVAERQGKPFTFAEALGQAAETETGVVVRKPGKSGAIGAEKAAMRREGRNSRLVDDLEQATGLKFEGDESADNAIDAMMQTARKAAKPVYDQAFAAPFSPSESLGRLMTNSAAVKKAIKQADSVAEDIAAVRGVPLEDVSVLERLDLAKRALDKQMRAVTTKAATGKATGDTVKHITDVRQAFVDALKESEPSGAYTAALKAGGDAPRMSAAIRTGEKAFDGTKVSKAIRATIAKMDANEVAAFRAGALRALFKQFSAKNFSPNNYGTPETAAKLRAIFGSEATDGLLGAMKKEERLAGFNTRLNPNANSITSQMLFHDDSRSYSLPVKLVMSLLKQPVTTAANIAQEVTDKLGRVGGMTQSQRDELGQVLLAPAEEGLAALRKAK